MILAAESVMAATLLQVTSARNAFVTPRNTALRNLRGMDEDNWRNLKEPWERVKWARQRWQRLTNQADNAAAAARALGMKGGTYRAYERSPDSSKLIKLEYDQAKEFARKFKVSWIWLLSGEQSPFTDELPAPQKRVTQLMSEIPEPQQERFANAATEFIQILTNRNGAQ